MRLPAASSSDVVVTADTGAAEEGQQQQEEEEEVLPSGPAASNGTTDSSEQQQGCAASQDSLDDYYDAGGTLGRPNKTRGRSSLGHAASIVRPRPMSRERRRHASTGGSSNVENGRSQSVLIENNVIGEINMDNHTSSPCIYNNKGPIVRVRHSSCSDTSASGVNAGGAASSGCSSPALQSRYSTPYHSAHFDPLETAPLTSSNHYYSAPLQDNSHVLSKSIQSVSEEGSRCSVQNKCRPISLTETPYASAATSARNLAEILEVPVKSPGHQQPGLVNGIGLRASSADVNHQNAVHTNGSPSCFNGVDVATRKGGSASLVNVSNCINFNSDDFNGLQNITDKNAPESTENESLIRKAIEGNRSNVNSPRRTVDFDLKPAGQCGQKRPVEEKTATIATSVGRSLKYISDPSCNYSNVNTECQSTNEKNRASQIFNRGNSKGIPVNYVECVEIQTDPTFNLSSDQCYDSSRKGHRYSEFSLDKCETAEPQLRNKLISKLVSQSTRSASPVNESARATDVDSPGWKNGSKSSSCLSINFSWKRNYVPFIDVEKILGITADSVVTVGCAEEPLLQEASSPMTQDMLEAAPDKVVTMYTFNKANAGKTWSWREELALGNLRLTHPAPHLFVGSQWQQYNRMSCLYLGYRLFWALYFTMWAGWSLAGEMGYGAPWHLKGYYFTYLTNWSIWVLAFDTVLQAAIVVMHMRRVAENGDGRYSYMPKCFRVSWVLSNITFATHLFVTLGYWTTVYPLRSDTEMNIISINTHLVPGVYVLLDSLVSATPRRLLHAFHPAIYCLVYVIFSMIYYLGGGTDYMERVALYPFLDWTRPGRSLLIVSFVLLLLVPLLHALLCGIYALRVRLWRRYRLSRYTREDGEMKCSKLVEQIV